MTPRGQQDAPLRTLSATRGCIEDGAFIIIIFYRRRRDDKGIVTTVRRA